MDFGEGVFVAGFFVVDFLVVGFLVVGFLVVVDLVVVVLADLVAGFAAALAVVAGLTPAALAILTRLALRREAVFFLMRPFLAALSYSD